jgi:hypothetical protein
MLYVEFAPIAGAALRKGPFGRLVLEAQALRSEAHESLVATHRHARWVLPDGYFVRMRIHGPLTVALVRPKDPPLAFGPYTLVAFADGVAYGDGVAFAYSDAEMLTWFGARDDRRWKRLQLAPAPQRGAA